MNIDTFQNLNISEYISQKYIDHELENCNIDIELELIKRMRRGRNYMTFIISKPFTHICRKVFKLEEITEEMVTWVEMYSLFDTRHV